MTIKPITPLDLHEQVTQPDVSAAEKERIVRAVNNLLNKNVEQAMGSQGFDFPSADVGSDFKNIRKLFGDDWLVLHYWKPVDNADELEERIIFKQKR